MPSDEPRDEFTRLDGVQVLVADDNSDARVIYKEMLTYAGASVMVVDSALAAVRTLRHVRPDVVVTDLWMPRKDGFWLIEWVRRRDSRQGRHLSVIAVTARDDLYDAATATQHGFDAYLRKPVPPRDLFRVISHLARLTNEIGATSVARRLSPS